MDYIYWALGLFHLLISVCSVGHALLFKRNPRSALGWIGICLFFPLAGPFLYFLFGINRVRTRAQKLDRHSPFLIPFDYDYKRKDLENRNERLKIPREFTEIARMSDAVTRRPLIGGNQVDLMSNGEGTYPQMLTAIERAREYLYLSTYIFESNQTGWEFIQALSRTARRGVQVRVLIDGVGELYSLPRTSTLLARQGVRVARFLPPKLFPPTLHVNLRNHRKILVADGRTAFVGGMNLGDRHLAHNTQNPHRVADLHFRVRGPVVEQISHVFMEDWRFVTGEHLKTPAAEIAEQGDSICRTIMDGPNEDLDKLHTILVCAISAARKRIAIMTPYFLPTRELISALQAAALRGVKTEVILPAQNNLPFVHWATRNLLWEILQRGVRVFYQPPPFAHSKLFIVDNHYAQIGSANIDSRSLRLNFELNIEVYDRAFAKTLTAHFEKALHRSREVTLDEVDSRPLPVRIRDSVAWLFTPYL